MSRIDSQEKIRYLRRYRLNELEIVRLKEELERWRSQAEQVTSSAEYRGKTANDTRLQRAVDRLGSTEAMLTAQLTDRVRRRDSIEAAISEVEDERLQLLLRYRYIDGLTWEKIAQKLHIDIRWVMRLHGRSLQKLTIESHY